MPKKIIFYEGSVSKYIIYIYGSMPCICQIYLSVLFITKSVFQRRLHYHSEGYTWKISHMKLNCFCYHKIDEFPSGFYPIRVSKWNSGDQGELQMGNIFSGILGVVIWPFRVKNLGVSCLTDTWSINQNVCIYIKATIHGLDSILLIPFRIINITNSNQGTSLTSPNTIC